MGIALIPMELNNDEDLNTKKDKKMSCGMLFKGLFDPL